MENRPTFVVMSGLPGVGKSEISKQLSKRLGALYLRIDTIEQSLRNNGIRDVGPLGYEVAYRVAADNLKLGHNVIADCVNPIAITRDAWTQVAREAAANIRNVHVICSDLVEHRRRVETRVSQIHGHVLPDWDEVLRKQAEFEAWKSDTITIDTASRTVEDCVEEAFQAVSSH
ncbi:MAG: AAA family ATPase [Deltaproteobacteria bacterium]|nr:AAA family ATPase [Deltaproteobacteria bacterium]